MPSDMLRQSVEANQSDPDRTSGLWVPYVCVCCVQTSAHHVTRASKGESNGRASKSIRSAQSNGEKLARISYVNYTAITDRFFLSHSLTFGCREHVQKTILKNVARLFKTQKHFDFGRVLCNHHLSQSTGMYDSNR
jgi:hypothetical protein